MIYDLQKADFWKRISAALFDLIMLGVLIICTAMFLSAALKFDHYVDTLSNKISEYGITLSYDDYQALDDAGRQAHNDAIRKAFKSPDFLFYYDMTINLTLIITIFSVLISYLLLEFVVPLIFKNGQTLGKKIFGLGVMRSDGVRVTNFMMFVRTLLGKCTVETLIPVLIIIMIFIGAIGIVGIAILFGLLVSQIILLIANKTRTPIHDLMAHTVVIDLSSQMIFETPEDLLEYKKKMQADKVAKETY